MKQGKIVILYERLSRDDDTDSESNSIKNPKIILEDYAVKNGMTNFIHMTDDGISGLRFEDRPGYVQMMEMVEDDKVAAVVLKDITRLGRDYLRVGMCMETMRLNGVRLIALGDGIDTAKGEDDFTPFRTVMAEFYAKDTSRKIKSAYKAKSASGKPVSSYPPYGFLKSPEDKCKWFVDEEAAAIVRRIFQMTMEGKGPYQICCTLKAEKVPIPAYYLAQKGAGPHQKYSFPDPYNWHSGTVCSILKKEEYLGHTVNFKTRKHFKDKKSHYVDESQWTIIENTHEAIIDQETFDNVQRIRGNIKRRPDGWGYLHPLSGLLWCSDCGGKLYVHRIYNGKEQDALDKEITLLEATVYSYEDGSVRAKRFIELVNRYTDFTEFTIPMLNEFVNKIIVHERDQKGQIQSTQKVEIHLNFIGEYLPPTLRLLSQRYS